MEPCQILTFGDINLRAFAKYVITVDLTEGYLY